MWPSIGQSVTLKCWSQVLVMSERHKCWSLLTRSAPAWPGVWGWCHQSGHSLTLSDLWLPPSVLHNSELRDSHSTRSNKFGVSGLLQGSIEGGLLETMLTEAYRTVYYHSAHSTYSETMCVHLDVTQIWVVLDVSTPHSLLLHVMLHTAVTACSKTGSWLQGPGRELQRH